MTNFLIDYAKKNMEKLLDGALKELRYICCFTCIAKEFEEEKAWLKAERRTVRQRVQLAKGRGEDVQANALFWEEEVDKIIEEDSKTKQKCFFGLCPDCIWRYKSGKELENKKEKIKRFVDTGKELAIGLPALLPDVERYSSRHYISFKSRISKYNELLDALEDEQNYIIGLQGMGGTGKTTLAKEVGKKLKQSEQFKYVIDTTVSFSPNIKKIQDDIAGPLGLRFNECSESDRPKKLWKRLTNGENILLILDDVWGDIDFEEIGIPYSDSNKGCRILVTTRNMLVCKRLGCNKTIKLELLSQDDAWEMFKRHAGLTENSSQSLIDLCFKIANECQGLPIAIAIIASSLKGKQHREEWDLALKSLQKHAPIDKIDDDDDDDDDNLVKVYERLKFSYDNMKDGKSKRLFLLCSVFPEDEEIPTERLIRLGIGAGLFGEKYGNYKDARSQVVISKNKLLDSCLLLEVDDDRVKMHDLVRDAAQWIANKEIQTIRLYDKNQKAMVEREKNIKYLLCEGKLKDVLSCKIDSSKLQILIVNMHEDGDFYDQKIEVPNSFFENISGLRVFYLFTDLYQLPLSLPQSIQTLKNIRSLLFYAVDLGDITILGNLQSLETLDLEFCKINEFPKGMENLPNFRLLKLRFCDISWNNPFKVIEGCSSLEELYFIRSFNDCCREISFPLLQRFILTDDPFPSDNDSLSKCVSLIHQEHLLSKRTLKDCIQAAEALRLTGIWWEWVNIIPDIVPMDHGMNDLVELTLSCISQLKCLVHNKHGNSQVTTVFSKLVKLQLIEMECLEELCNGPLSFNSLKSLEYLSIVKCDQLQRIFTCNLNLCNLKSLILMHCPMLITVSELTTSRSLMSLEELKISKCEKIEYIIDERKEKESRGEIVDDECMRSHKPMFPKLRDLHIDQCHGLEFKFLFLSIQDLPALESLSISCRDQLQYIFSQYVQLGSLKNMDLQNLPNLINIFPKCHPTTSSGEASKPEKQLEPMKGSIFLWTNICCLGKKYRHKSMTNASTTLSLNYLSWIKIERCEKLEFVFSTSTLRCLPQLIFLKIEECKELKHLIEDDLENEKSITFRSANPYFPKLEILIVGNCNKLKCIFQTSVCKELPKLKFLMIREAYELQEIFKTEGDDQKLEIPNLKVVSFINLPNLCYAQEKHFQAVKYRLVQNCHKLSLTSALIPNNSHDMDDFEDIFPYMEGLDFQISGDIGFLMQPLINVNKSYDTCKEKPSLEIPQEFAAGVEAEAASESESILTSSSASESGSILTSSQPQVLVNEQSMDQQHSLQETDTTIKPQLDGSAAPDKTLAANSSTISETKKEPPIQLVFPKQKKDGDCQIATTSLSIATTETNDKVSPNADASMKVSSNVEEQFPKDDKIIVSNSKPSPKGDPSQKVEELSSCLPVTRDYEKLSLFSYELNL
ncbi:unnamed protein product [Lathyrus sativus]|nr:unnamed protein product [Lathyrus sativus]